jgi:peptidoglycan/LPS O-acetylase OafA/YrhL
MPKPIGGAAGNHDATGRNREIEALRGVAILMVLVEHMPLNLFDWVSRFYAFTLRYWRGAAGVDLFFAISGYVIARGLVPAVLAAEPASRMRIVVAFWNRRIWRLAPAAWLWVLIPVAMSAAFNRSGAFNRPGQNAWPAIAALLNVANIWEGLFWPKHIAGITSPYWSLSLEEQFYVLFPLALLLLRKKLAWFMAALFAYQFVLPDTTLALLTRPGDIAGGVLIALTAGRAWQGMAPPRPIARRAWMRPAALLAWVALSGGLLGERFPFGNGPKWGLEACLCTALVWAAARDRGLVLADSGLSRVLQWIGARSYSLYLVHMPMFALAHEIASRAGLAVHGHDARAVVILLSLALPATLAAAMLTYRWIEMPLRAYGAKA